MTFKGDKALSQHPKYVGSISIPEEVTYNKKRYRVTTIVDKAFAYCDGLASVIILNPIPPDIERELFVRVFLSTSLQKVWKNTKPQRVGTSSKTLWRYLPNYD